MKWLHHPLWLALQWNGALHSVDYVHRSQLSPVSSVTPLVDLCCEVIINDASFTSMVLQILPRELYFQMMRVALSKGKDRAVEVMLTAWPCAVLPLKTMLPNLYTSLKMLYDSDFYHKKIRQGMTCTTSLMNKYLDMINSGIPTKLRVLDLRDFPTSVLTVNKLCQQISHDMKTDTENASACGSRDTEEPSGSRNRPQDSCIFMIECILRDGESFHKLDLALQRSRSPSSRIQLQITKIDASFFGEAMLQTLFQHLQQEHLTGLCIQMNSLGNTGIIKLAPTLTQFKNLTMLDISGNNINLVHSTNPATALHNCFQQLQSLIRLDLSNNRLTGNIKRLLCDIPKGLEYLNICACLLSESDLMYLSKSHHARSLLELDISENGLSKLLTSFQKLLHAVSQQLQILEIEDCRFSSEHLPQLVVSLLKLEKLRYLNISHHQFCTESLCSEISRLGWLPALEHLTVSFSIDVYDDEDGQFTDLNNERKSALTQDFEQNITGFRKQRQYGSEVEVVWTEQQVAYYMS